MIVLGISRVGPGHRADGDEVTLVMEKGAAKSAGAYPSRVSMICATNCRPPMTGGWSVGCYFDLTQERVRTISDHDLRVRTGHINLRVGYIELLFVCEIGLVTLTERRSRTICPSDCRTVPTHSKLPQAWACRSSVYEKMSTYSRKRGRRSSPYRRIRRAGSDPNNLYRQKPMTQRRPRCRKLAMVHVGRRLRPIEDGNLVLIKAVRRTERSLRLSCAKRSCAAAKRASIHHHQRGAPEEAHRNAGCTPER
jgi:hypothetical protein